MSYLGDNLFHILRHKDLYLILIELLTLGFDNGDFLFDGGRIVGLNLSAVSVLERRDNAAAVGIVFRVGAGDEENIERQPDAVAPNLDIPLLHQIEKTDLKFFSKVRQFVYAEDAAVGPGHHAVVYGQLVRKIAALGNLDRVHIAD